MKDDTRGAFLGVLVVLSVISTSVVARGDYPAPVLQPTEDTSDFRSLSVGAPVYGLAFSLDGGLLATAGKNGVRLWRATSGERAVPLVDGTIPPPTKIRFWGGPFAGSPIFSRDGRLVAAAEYLPPEDGRRDVARGRCRVWDVASGKLRAKRDFHKPLTALAFSPKGAQLAIGDSSNGFGICQIAEQTIWYQRGEWRLARTADVAFSPNGALLAVANDPDEGRKYVNGTLHVPVKGGDCTIRLIDTTTKKTLHEISVKATEGLHRLAFAADGMLLYAAYEDGHMRLWDVRSTKLVTSYRVQTEPRFFTPIAFSSDGEWLAIRDRDDGPIAIWDVAAGQKVAAVAVSTNPSDSLALSFAARLLAVADPDDKKGTVSLWRVGSVLTMADDMARIAKSQGHRALLQRVTALRRTHATAVVTSALTKLLSYKERKIKAAAAFVFGKLDIMPKEALPELIAVLNSDYTLTTMLYRYGSGVLPEMLAEVVLANDENSDDAGYALMCIGGKSVVPTLMKGLESSDNEIRSHVAELLGELGSEAKDAVPALIKIVKSHPTDAGQTPTDDEVTDNDIRGSAACALGQIGVESETVVPLLIAAVKEDDIRVRERAAWGLGEFGAKAKAAIPVLIEALKDPRFEVPTILCATPGGLGPDHWAAAALVSIGPDSVPALAKALGSEDMAIRRHAADALSHFGSEGKPATDALIQAAKDRDPRLRRLALLALSRVKPDPELVMPLSVAALDDSDARVRSAAAFVLERIGRKAHIAVPKILETLKDKNSEVRKAMIRALSTTTNAEVAVPVLARMLRDPDHYVRGVAAYVLGGFGPKARVAIPALTEALDDEDDWVRDHARHALEKIDSKGRPNH